MGRDEEINQATDAYMGNYCADMFGACVEDVAQAFRDGIEWADKHPANVWHSSDEEPDRRRDGGILCEHDFYYWVATKPYLSSICGNWHKKVKREHMIRWAYISDLLPKGGE